MGARLTMIEMEIEENFGQSGSHGDLPARGGGPRHAQCRRITAKDFALAQRFDEIRPLAATSGWSIDRNDGQVYPDAALMTPYSSRRANSTVRPGA
jgi:hypothetical protein